MIQIEHRLSITRRCALLDIARSTAYYRPKPVSDDDLRLMRLIDEIHLELPFYGSRRLAGELEDRGHGPVNRKRALLRSKAVDRRWHPPCAPVLDRRKTRCDGAVRQ